MQPPPLPPRVPPVVLVNAQAKPTPPKLPGSNPPVAPGPNTALPLFEDKERMLQYGKWGGLAFLALLVLSALFNGGEGVHNDSYASPSSSGGSYEDRMNAGIAELGGTYDSSSGTMSTNRN